MTVILGLDASTLRWVKGTCSVLLCKGACNLNWGAPLTRVIGYVCRASEALPLFVSFSLFLCLYYQYLPLGSSYLTSYHQQVISSSERHFYSELTSPSDMYFAFFFHILFARFEGISWHFSSLFIVQAYRYSAVVSCAFRRGTLD